MNLRFIRNVFIKGVALFLIFNFAYAAIKTETLGKISLYNHIFTGRERFPFGENSSQSYNLSLFNLDAMFASHIIAASPKLDDEYRVVLIGDSSTWGTLLRPEETLAGQLNQKGLSSCGKKIQAYNLGYPTISLTKDLLILDYALRYQPDLIIWLVSLEAFHADNQLSSPIISNNASRIGDLISRYSLPLDPNSPELVHPGFWDETLLGQRRPLADLVRLQMYGILWSATGIDQIYPTDYQRAQTDFDSNLTYHNMQPPTMDISKLAFGLLDAGFLMAEKTPMILVNEPILISNGINSSLRYNFLYPRWAYDEWRGMMTARAIAGGWSYFDAWNIVPATEFTNSAIHLTPEGESILATRVEQYISDQSCP